MVGLVLLLLVPAGPVPPAPPAAPPGVDRDQAHAFAVAVVRSAEVVAGMTTPRAATARELVGGAVRGLYEEAGVPVPEEVRAAVAGARDPDALRAALVDARVRLGSPRGLAGARSLVVAVHGFRHADPHGGVVSPHATPGTPDIDFGVGLDLDGMTVPRCQAYRLDRLAVTAGLPASWRFGPAPKPDAVPAPASAPWTVARVIPGGPAQKAGVAIGDVITHLDGEEVTAGSADRLFARWAFGAGDGPAAGKRAVRLRRAGAARPVEVTLAPDDYTAEVALGVVRHAGGWWDYRLDREYRIGYVRLGPLAVGSEAAVAESLDGLLDGDCRGLVLDLRFCPGGYVEPAARIAGLFLPPGTPVLDTRSDNPSYQHMAQVYRAAGGRFLKPPVVALVGLDSSGVPEWIAAALQDHGRAVVIGQRTAGRGTFGIVTPLGNGLSYRATIGTCHRPNGAGGGKLPDSRPTDPWGVRPDPGLGVPVTPDLNRQLRRWADDQAARPAEGWQALPWDDPAKDPGRAAALAYLRQKLGRPAE